MCHTITSKRDTNTLVHEVLGQIAIPRAGVVPLVVLNLHQSRWLVRSLLSCEKEVMKHHQGL